MSDRTIELVRALRPADAQRPLEIFRADRRAAMLSRILAQSPTAQATERRRPPGRSLARRTLLRSAPRRAVLGLAAAVAAAAAVATLLPGSAVRPQSASAVAFRTTASGDVVATVTDPFAAQQRLDAAFAAHGFKIAVRLIPVSPSMVGTVVAFDDDAPGIAPLGRGRCVTGGGACPIGIRVARWFRGSGSITLGRSARAGESYDSTASAFAPGETLHCSGLLGARVGNALGALRARGISVAWWREMTATSETTDTAPPLGSFIWSADPVAPGKIGIWTRPEPWPADRLHGSAANAGC